MCTARGATWQRKPRQSWFIHAESLSTLKFANRAKNIRNAARVNEDVDQRTLLRKYERELRRLRAELQQRQRELVDKRHLLAVSATLLRCLQC